MLIRPATAADIPAITAIYNQAVRGTTASFDTEPRTVEDRMRWLDGRAARHPVLVAEECGTVLGWGALSPYSERAAYDGTAEISVYIDEARHRRGLGRDITGALVEAGTREGLHCILARICTENEGSIEMVRRYGFSEAGTIHQVGRKFDRWLDVVTWELLIMRGDAGT